MDIVVRATLGFVFIYALTRLIGRRELSTMGPFDLILLVVIGDIAQQGITQSDNSFTGLLLTVGTFAALTVLVSWMTFHFRRLRPILEGRPLIIVEDGKLVEANLARERITADEVAAEARQQVQIDSLDGVKWAVLESNGRMSFIMK
jgi:uncharacterized membrane protein YcaP (DUF421 family)